MRTVILCILVTPFISTVALAKDEKKPYAKCICDFSSAMTPNDCKQARPIKCTTISEDDLVRIKDDKAKYVCSLDAHRVCVDPMSGMLRGD